MAIEWLYQLLPLTITGWLGAAARYPAPASQKRIVPYIASLGKRSKFKSLFILNIYCFCTIIKWKNCKSRTICSYFFLNEYLFSFEIFIHLFIHLAVPGLSCSTRDLPWGLWNLSWGVWNLGWGVWDLVPYPRIKSGSPAFQGSPCACS